MSTRDEPTCALVGQASTNQPPPWRGRTAAGKASGMRVVRSHSKSLNYVPTTPNKQYIGKYIMHGTIRDVIWADVTGRRWLAPEIADQELASNRRFGMDSRYGSAG